MLEDGAIIVYPTDSCYALGCLLGNKQGVERIYRLRQLDKGHHMTLMCQDLSAIATYAKVDNQDYRLLKALTPGPYTFIIKGTNEVPRRLLHPKRRSIGIRVPDNTIAHALLEALGEPIMSATLLMPGDEFPLNEPYEMKERLKGAVDLIIDGGACGLQETSVLSLESGGVEILREGKGSLEFLQH
jgi:tRNA threonylcarbamoyl adenosine modification protein (Sua5/YciO/YrdC/YwlC family)